MSMMSSSPLWRRLGPVLGVAMIVSVAAAQHRTSPTASWLTLGVGLGTLAVGLASRRFWRGTGSSMARTYSGASDERDRQITLEAGYWTGLAAYLAVSVGMVAVMWQANAVIVFAAMLWFLVLVNFASVQWLDRHR